VQDRIGPAHRGIIARWKAAVDCRDIVRAYGVALGENGGGCCPFHDDQHASFQAWRDHWWCFAESRGGDALDFVMEQEGMSPREALAYVRGRWPVPGLERDGGQPGGRS
jgi:DNA primase